MNKINNIINSYFQNLEQKLLIEMNIANHARKNGCDPHEFVEIPLAKDIAERVENLIEVPNISKRIRELLNVYTREEAALHIGKDIASGDIGNFKTDKEKVDSAIRVSMALLTEGVVAAPIEGIASIDIDKNDDGSRYLRIYYSGPIRSAGGTAQALSVLVGDYVRRIIGLDRFKPKNELIERYVEEIRLYKTSSSLQYNPTDEEIRLIVKNCPICIDGDATEEYEVEGFRNIKELKSNRVRGGMALVIAEGLILKAPKVKKYVSKLGFNEWSFLDFFCDFQLNGNNKKNIELKPKEKYLDDLIGGRPLFSHPSRPGGFRLRYGRSRNTSFAAAGLNPATMVILDNFITNGTQLKVERPGKAAAISCVTSIDGPFVRLKSGDFIQISNYLDALKLKNQIEYIVDLGEILFNYGDFLENNHPLIPSSYTFDWWIQDYYKIIHKKNNIDSNKNYNELLNISGIEALKFACYGTPLHPKFTYMWHDISILDTEKLSYYISKYGSIIIFKEKTNSIFFEECIINNKYVFLKISIDNRKIYFELKNILEILLIKHGIYNNNIYIVEFEPLLVCLGLCDIESIYNGNISFNYQKNVYNQMKKCNMTTIECINKISNIIVKPRASSRIGARMGRPEKSNIRKMSPAAQVLFPLNEFGGNTRNINNAIKFKNNSNEASGKIVLKLGIRYCKSCNKETYKWKCDCRELTIERLYCQYCNIKTNLTNCPKCSKKTTCIQFQKIDIKNELKKAYLNLNINSCD